MSVPSIHDRMNAMNLAHVGRQPGQVPTAARHGSEPTLPPRRSLQPPPPPSLPPRRPSASSSLQDDEYEEEEEAPQPQNRPALPPRGPKPPPPPLPSRKPSGILPPPPPYSETATNTNPPARPALNGSVSSKWKASNGSSSRPASTVDTGPRKLPPVNHIPPAIDPNNWKKSSTPEITNGRRPSLPQSAINKPKPSLPARTPTGGLAPPILKPKKSAPELPRRDTAPILPPPVPTIQAQPTPAKVDPRKLGFNMSAKTVKAPLRPDMPRRPESVPAPEVPYNTRPAINLATKPTGSALARQPPAIPAARPDPQGSFQPPTDEACLKCRDFSQVDVHAANFPRHECTDIRRLAIDLTAPFPSATDKARAIFTWLHHNVAYDVDGFMNKRIKQQTTENVFQSGLAVCEGYATLFCSLALHAGLEAVKIGGYGKGFGHTQSGTLTPFQSNHAWNACRIDGGEWHLVDSCWGAGHIDTTRFYKEFSPNHFTMTNEEFREKHYPTEAKYQLCANTISWEEFYLGERAGPDIHGPCYHADKNYGISTIEPRAKLLKAYSRYTFRIAGACEHLQASKDWCLVVKSGKNDAVMKPDGKGGFVAEAVTDAAGSKLGIYTIDKFNGNSGKGLTPHAFESKRGANSWSYQSVCIWEVV